MLSTNEVNLYPVAFLDCHVSVCILEICNINKTFALQAQIDEHCVTADCNNCSLYKLSWFI